ncbi:hypothetical protein T492DRAFT_905754 [Pavlovales sp. CCMP2436]|nr:hypothetical protein T492DRAFT_905754 [Pavlovales sp. CCMP2436]
MLPYALVLVFGFGAVDVLALPMVDVDVVPSAGVAVAIAVASAAAIALTSSAPIGNAKVVTPSAGDDGPGKAVTLILAREAFESLPEDTILHGRQGVVVDSPIPKHVVNIVDGELLSNAADTQQLVDEAHLKISESLEAGVDITRCTIRVCRANGSAADWSALAILNIWAASPSNQVDNVIREAHVRFALEPTAKLLNVVMQLTHLNEDGVAGGQYTAMALLYAAFQTHARRRLPQHI